MQDVILYNGSPALLVNGLSGHSMPPASSSPTDSNSSNDGSGLNFINILRARFSYKSASLAPKFRTKALRSAKFRTKNARVKC